MNFTPMQIFDKFAERDRSAVEDMNNWMMGGITESKRLEFLEGRVHDLCGVVQGLCQYIEYLEQKKT
jgi:hypothetical protein